MAFPYWHGGSLLIKHARCPVLQRLKLPSGDFSHRHSILMAQSLLHILLPIARTTQPCVTAQRPLTHITQEKTDVSEFPLQTLFLQGCILEARITHSLLPYSPLLCCVPAQTPLKLCSKTICKETAHHSTHPKEGAHSRPKYRYHQCPTWPNNEFYLGYIQEYGWGVAYRSRSESKIATSPKPTPASMTAHHSWEPGTHWKA